MSSQRGIGRRHGIIGLLLAGGLFLGAAAHAQNAAPVISGSPVSTALPGQPYLFQPTASDPDGDRLAFGASGLPGWVKFDKRTGRLYGKPKKRHLGRTFVVRIAVSDGRASAVLPPFTITVAQSLPQVVPATPVAPPTPGPITGPPPAPAPTPVPAPEPVPAPKPVPPPTPVPGPVPEPVPAPTPPPAPVPAPSPEPPPAPPANKAPLISGSPPATVVEGELYGFVPTASDPDGDTLLFSISGKPSWATFSTNSGLLSGIPPAGSAATHSAVQISVSDGTATVALAPFSITVTTKPNSPPAIWGIPATTVNAREAYRFRPSASDPDGQPLRFAVERLPAWASFDTATGTLSGTPEYSQAGTYAGISISASDGQASTALAPFSIAVTVDNMPPSISGTPSESATVGQAYSFVPFASDLEGQPLTFSIANKPVWASFDSSTGRLSGTPTAANVGTLAGVTISVSDGQASTALAAFSITVLAATPGSATVSWSPPTSFEDGTPIANLAGYRVVYGESATDLASAVTIASAAITSATIEDLAPGTWYFAVKAYTTANVESELSSIASKTIK